MIAQGGSPSPHDRAGTPSASAMAIMICSGSSASELNVRAAGIVGKPAGGRLAFLGGPERPHRHDVVDVRAHPLPDKRAMSLVCREPEAGRGWNPTAGPGGAYRQAMTAAP